MKIVGFWSEVDLLNGLKDNTEAAIRQIYKSNFSTIENFIHLNGGNSQDAKDVFQEGILVLYRNVKVEGFALNCKIKTYLYSVCKRIWLTELKRKNKAPTNTSETEDIVSIEDSDIEKIEENNNMLNNLSKSLELLGEPCKAILTDFYLNNLSMQDIAIKMGYTNADNAKTQKYKCLLRLKKVFFKNEILSKKII